MRTTAECACFTRRECPAMDMPHTLRSTGPPPTKLQPPPPRPGSSSEFARLHFAPAAPVRMASTQLLLQIWLYFVAAMRLLSVVLGYFFPEKLLGNVFGKLPAVAKEARDNQELDQGASAARRRRLPRAALESMHTWSSIPTRETRLGAPSDPGGGPAATPLLVAARHPLVAFPLAPPQRRTSSRARSPCGRR